MRPGAARAPEDAARDAFTGLWKKAERFGPANLGCGARDSQALGSGPSSRRRGREPDVTSKRISNGIGVLAMITNAACVGPRSTTPTFGDDVAFLKQHTDVIVLADGKGEAQVAIVPAWQGRVMTTTAQGTDGTSFGWVNRALIAEDELRPHINVFGGEDRFWLGPEGGQFSIFFAPGATFDLAHWYTPAAIDTDPYDVIETTRDTAVFRRKIELTNYSGTKLKLTVKRAIALLDASEALGGLGVKLPTDAHAVAVESVNSITNTGEQAWTKETGLLSIWILGMMNATPSTTVVIPFEKGDESARGPIVNDAYFGKVPADRLRVKDDVILFRADAKHRSKIGVSPKRAKPILGSYDAANEVLTIVQYTWPEGSAEYVNSMWEIQKDPFSGDVVNSYNDGPPSPGAPQFGDVYELETSSPALALAPKQVATHIHRTIHVQAREHELDKIARKLFGIGVAEIKNEFR